MSEGAPTTRHREPLHRSLFVPIEDLDLNTVEGQNEMLKRMQTLLSTKDHNTLDLNAFKILKDTVRVKTDLNVLRLYDELRKRMEAFEKKQQTSEEI